MSRREVRKEQTDIFSPDKNFSIERAYKDRLNQLPQADRLSLDTFMKCAIGNVCLGFLCEKYTENQDSFNKHALRTVLETLYDSRLLLRHEVDRTFYGITAEFATAIAFKKMGMKVIGSTTYEDAKMKVDLWALNLKTHEKYAIQVKSGNDVDNGIYILPNNTIEYLFQKEHQDIISKYAKQKGAEPICVTIKSVRSEGSSIEEYLNDRIDQIVNLFGEAKK